MAVSILTFNLLRLMLMLHASQTEVSLWSFSFQDQTDSITCSTSSNNAVEIRHYHLDYNQPIRTDLVRIDICIFILTSLVKYFGSIQNWLSLLLSLGKLYGHNSRYRSVWEWNSYLQVGNYGLRNRWICHACTSKCIPNEE